MSTYRREVVLTWETDPPNGALPADVDPLELIHALDALHAAVPLDSLSFARLHPGSPPVWRYRFVPADGQGRSWQHDVDFDRTTTFPPTKWKIVGEWTEPEWTPHRLVRHLCYVWGIKIPSLVSLTAAFPVDEVVP